jgi:hypothetical protein
MDRMIRIRYAQPPASIHSPEETHLQSSKGCIVQGKTFRDTSVGDGLTLLLHMISHEWLTNTYI